MWIGGGSGAVVKIGDRGFVSLSGIQAVIRTYVNTNVLIRNGGGVLNKIKLIYVIYQVKCF